MVMRNALFKARTVGIGVFTLEEAIDWGATGPGPPRLRHGMGHAQKAALQRL